MESVISGLLEDFEAGKMTRRQLIQSLAMAALTPAAVAAQPEASATATRSAWKTVCLDHISYAVTDYKRSAAFYRDLMGWTIHNDNGTNQATLDIGEGIGTIIIRNTRPRADAPAQ
ncbi:MAG: VOC family protein, partial [Acidobacteria bacterium]|nr:VOC family protein [Acidobacteriota bacterium]